MYGNDVLVLPISEVAQMVLIIGVTADEILSAYPDMSDELKAIIYKCKAETVVKDGTATHKRAVTRVV